MRILLRRWWWLPLIVVIALVIKTTLLAAWASEIARSDAAEAAGLPIERVEADGLNITLTGFADRAELDEAVTAVEALDSSRSVVGLMASDDGLVGDDGDASRPTTTLGSEPLGDDEVETDLVIASVDLELTGSGGALLSGSVADDDVRAALVEGAGSIVGAAGVTDELTLDPEAVAVEGGTLVVRGETSNDEQRATWLNETKALVEALGWTLIDEISVAPVDTPLQALLDLEAIEFDERRAMLGPGSRVTLDAAAELIRSNPQAGRVRVVGHTDSDGGPIGNQGLSERRARAVYDYLVQNGGVDESRLDVLGLGETRLLVDPERDAQDKQRNRRIEWELLS